MHCGLSNLFGLQITGISTETNDGGEHIQICQPEEKSGEKKITSLNDHEKENIEKALFLLDKFCASDELYHEMVQVRPNNVLTKCAKFRTTL